MKNIGRAKWIKSAFYSKPSETLFFKAFKAKGKVASASLEITALGVYEAKINDRYVGNFIFAPGWTSYTKRLQVQTYDVGDMLSGDNLIEIGVAPGWKGGTWSKYAFDYLGTKETALLCALTIEYEDGTSELILSGGDWSTKEGKTVYSDLYNGFVFDPSKDGESSEAAVFEIEDDILIDTEGEKIIEHERYPVKKIIHTPKGETVLDFGVNSAGYIEFKIKGKKGERAVIQHGEVLDKDGNFYRDNLRDAKAEAVVICDGEEHIIKPAYNFFGFRYAKLINFSDEILKENFTFITIYSDMERTGHFECSDERVNRLYENAIRSQRSNFIDVPTDCPQRDERLGWTGDAQVFIKTASYNYNVNRFFEKWLADLRCDQTEWGTIPHVIPNVFDPNNHCSAAWADAATVCPRQLYLTYGNREIIEKSLNSMKKFVDYMTSWLRNGIWADTPHFGDWLNLDAPEENDCSAGTDKNLIATAYYIYSSGIFINSVRLCGGSAEEIEKYSALRENSIKAFRREYTDGARIKPEFATQTACILAAQFKISPDIAKTASQLNELVTECGHLKTGFVGTPFLLHVLSDNGFAKTAYDLLLREEYPSWLYEVKMGATTIWEHWDSMSETGEMWSTGMNSFNHYAYGSVCDWLYGTAAGINTDEQKPGFEHIIFAPQTDERLSFVKASIDTKYGTVISSWKRENGVVTYSFTVPQGAAATVFLNGKAEEIGSGTFTY